MRLRVCSDLTAIFAACALSVAAEAGADPAAVVREHFVRYAAGDLHRASQLWVAGAPAEDFVRRHRARLAKRCIRLESLTIDAVPADPLVFDATSTMTLRAASPNSLEWWESSRSRFTLQREHDQWRIASWEPRESELVDRLVSATNDAERTALLDATAELQTTTFVRLASQRAIDSLNQSRIGESLMLGAAASAVAERLGDPLSMSAGLSAGSITLRRQKDMDASLTMAEEAVMLADGGGDPDVLARALVSLTRVREERDGIPDPELVERAVAMSAEIENVALMAHAAVHLGRSHEYRGRYREAFRYAELALRFAEDSGDRAALTSASILLHGAYGWTGESDLAVRHGRRALELSLEAGFEASAAAMAGVLVALGDQNIALRVASDVLAKLKDPLAKAVLLRSRHVIYRNLDRCEEAERDLDYAEAHGQADPSGRQEIANARTVLAIWRRDDEAALRHVDAGRGPNVIHDRSARRLRAEILLRLGQLGEARTLLEEVIAEGETTAIHDPERSLFQGQRQPSHRLLVELLVKQGDPAGALRLADALKSKQLNDAIAHGRSAAATTPEEQSRERVMEARIRELNRRLVGGDASGATRSSIRKELAAARVELLDLRQRMYVHKPEAPAPRPVELRIDDLPASLDDVTIVSYVVGDRKMTVLVLEPKKDGRREITVRTIGVESHHLFWWIKELATLVEQRNLRASAKAAEMYDLLIAPIEPSIRNARSLCIIPDTGLWRVPFQALGPKGGPLLIDRLPVFYAPSIALLASPRPDRPKPGTAKPSLLAFANPTVRAETASLYRAFDPDAPLGAIPETEWEVRAIARIYGKEASRIYIGETARETTLKQEASRFDVLHIATHGVAYDSAPGFSSLLLTTAPGDESEDGLLEAREIAALALNTDLTVLSACETGRATMSGSGVIGLSWAFLVAGVPTTVVSQWKAHSAASALLMVEFHRQLTRGVSRPEALRRAQLALRRDRRYRHSFYWAPFMVIGMP